MSIIYEALKKTQADPEGTNRQDNIKGKDLSRPKASLMKKQLAISITGAALGVLFAWVIINKLSAPPARPIAQPARPEKPEQPSSGNASINSKAQEKTQDTAGTSLTVPHLILSGILLSEEGNIAMINNQIYKVGDEIEGARIVEISASRVALSFKNQEIVLKNK